MNEIKCPNCGKVFQVDEAGYATIIKRVRDSQFNSEIQEREKALYRQFEAEQQAALVKANSDFKAKLGEKEREIASLNEQVKAAKADKQHTDVDPFMISYLLQLMATFSEEIISIGIGITHFSEIKHHCL